MNMNRIITALFVLALAATISFAGETFGGIGVTILATNDGVKVVEVIPGSPAAEAGVEAGDHITAVDLVSIAGNDIEKSKELLRGTAGKPLELTIMREKEALSISLRRTQITIQDLDASQVSTWYGKSQATFSAEELEVVAEHSAEKGLELLSVMQNGHVVSKEAVVAPEALSSVFVAASTTEPAPAVSTQSKNVRPVATLQGFTRQEVSFMLRETGNVAIRIVDPRGEQVALLEKQNASAGDQAITWKGDKATSGHYLVYVEQNGAASAFSADLR
jgi:membrane-associated protease RseP (regulator of RpoE activity)